VILGRRVQNAYRTFSGANAWSPNLLEAGAEVISIKELLGHASIGSSERYAKLSNQRVKEVYRQTIRKVIAKTRV